MEYHFADGTLLVVQVVPEFVEVQMTPPTYAPAILVPSADVAIDVNGMGYGPYPGMKKVGELLVFHVAPPFVEIKMKLLYG